MLKKIFSLLLLVAFASSCASTKAARSGPAKPKAFVTPYEYYSTTRPAVMTPEDSAPVRKAEFHSTGEDTKEDHTQAIVIGTIVGISVIGGTVAGILLAR